MTEIMSIVTTALCGYIVWYLKEQFDNKNKIGKVMKILLRGEIYHLHQKYMERKYIEPKELSEFLELCDLYAYYKGNGTGEKMREDVKSLELRGE